MSIYKREQNIFIDIGTDFSKTFIVKDRNNAVIDLTDYSISASMKKNYISKASTNFTASIDTPVDGIISISLIDTITADLDEARYVYDVILTNDNGLKHKAFYGIATINSTVTT